MKFATSLLTVAAVLFLATSLSAAVFRGPHLNGKRNHPRPDGATSAEAMKGGYALPPPQAVLRCALNLVLSSMVRLLSTLTSGPPGGCNETRIAEFERLKEEHRLGKRQASALATTVP